jgi:hypothetical protein
MRNLFVLLALMFLCKTYSQEQSPFIIKHCSDSAQYFASKGLICSNDLRTKWFMIVPSYEYENGEVSNNGFIVIKCGIGNCSKEDWMIINFTDHSKLTLRSSNKELTCGTDTFFNTDAIAIQDLSIKTIDNIRYINGNDLKSFTYYATHEESVFFLNMYNNFIIVKVNCR